MGKPKAPKTPDYAAAAVAQGQANTNSAIATNYLNQANQVTPDGNLTYSYSHQATPGTAGTPARAAVYDKKGNLISPAVAATAGTPGTASNGGHTLPDGTYIPDTTVTTTLSPAQQKLYDQNNQISTDLNDLAIRGTGYVDEATKNPLTQSQFGTLQGGLNSTAGQMTTGVNAGPIQSTFGATDPTQKSAGTNAYTDSYDYSKASALPQSSDFAAQRDLVTNALMQRNQPFMDKARAREENQLVNQGINRGSAAYGSSQDQLSRNENDASIAALLAGSQEQQRLYEDAMSSRQQGISEATNQGNIANQAAAGNFSQGLANANLANSAIAQDYTQNAGRAQFANDAQAAQFGQGQQNAALNNSTQQNIFNQGLASGQFTNQAQAQAIQQADYFKNQPLNMLNALRSGNQTQMPSFGQVSAGATIAPAPIYAATNDAYQGQLQAYQQKSGMFGDMIGGLSKIGGAAIAASDRRLKTNIQKLGELKPGLGVYYFNYLWDEKPQIGFMADEVRKIKPEAVITLPCGYDVVDYGMVL